MRIIVGCPTRNRTWILPEWKKFIEAALPEEAELTYAFVVGDDDRETVRTIMNWNAIFTVVEEEDTRDVRSWGDATRFEHMVNLRNTLLGLVRAEEPDYFLSLDSDILLHPDALKNMIETMEKFSADAVGGLTYFDPVDKRCTNVANWHGNSKSRFTRVISDGTHPVDIIMGIKLMSPEAYNVDYSFHRLGEDLGWCKNMADKNIYYDGRVASKHVMSREWLERVDKRTW